MSAGFASRRRWRFPLAYFGRNVTKPNIGATAAN